ncbi:hypothetical protein SAMN04487945_2298 [Halobacterium jilantaiense]|uniref:DUF8100 domain-containing protein n=2 Tax=Halobacterium jilantaiense TaxID=355548 RepID=A0A1I0Q5L4_9EURY|nr:hypothetical protein SAMN04487945_2298 [Halobacterium jilantaiense]
MVAVGALEGLWVAVVLGGVAGLLGVTLYLGIRRYETELEQFYATQIDYASRPAFAYTLFQTVALAVAFGGGLYFALSFDLVAPVSEWVPDTDSLVVLGGALLGLALGAGYPPVMRHQDLVPMLRLGRWASELDVGLFVTACIVLLFRSDPLSVVVFGVAYLGSRLAYLGSVYGSVRSAASST